MQLGLVQLVEVAFDGTRVKADASRFHTWTAAKVETLLAELETQAARLLDEAEADDAAPAAKTRSRCRRNWPIRPTPRKLQAT
jgi:hypothetical protein